MLNIFEGHLQLRCHLPLFHNFKCFNIKIATAHFCYLKGGEWANSQGCHWMINWLAGFYSNGFVAPKHTGFLWPILHPRWSICYMHTSFSDDYYQIDMATYLARCLCFLYWPQGCLFPHSYCLASSSFLTFCLAELTLSVEGFAIWGWPQPPGFPLPLLNPYC